MPITIPTGYITEHGSFLYKMIEISDETDSVKGWSIVSIGYDTKMRKFSCNSTYEGYPIISLNRAFAHYEYESLDVSGMDTSNVIDMSNVFAWAQELRDIDISMWDTHNVRNTHEMFLGCTEIKTIDIRNLHVDTAERMFYLCDNILYVVTSSHNVVNTFKNDDSFFILNITNKKFNSININSLMAKASLTGNNKLCIHITDI